jgi:hypothetical protein
LVIHMTLTSCSSVTSSRVLHRLYSIHSTPVPISTGMGKTLPLHPALHGS